MLRPLRRCLGPVSRARQARIAGLPIDALEDLGEAPAPAERSRIVANPCPTQPRRSITHGFCRGIV